MNTNKRDFKLIVIRPDMVVIFMSDNTQTTEWLRGQGPKWCQGLLYEMGEAAEWLRVNTDESDLKIAIMQNDLEFGEELRGEMK